MTSRALRIALLLLFVGLLGGAAYLVGREELQVRADALAETTFADQVQELSRSLLEIKSAQAGYVAAGQGEDFWMRRVDALFASVRGALAKLRAEPHSQDVRTELDATAVAVEDFEQMDRRARNYARSAQRLLASDLVFSDGIEKIDGAVAALDRARSADLAARRASIDERRRSQVLALGGAAAFGLIVVFALTPLPRDRAPAVPERAPAPPSRASADDSLPLKRTIAPEPVAERPPAPAPPPPPTIDLSGMAALCTDLARVYDTAALPAALERAATLLGASGLVIWVVDADARELVPTMGHGYPQHVLARMGTMKCDAENVTAAAFRSGILQTVNADAASPGAIAAPLVTPGGPVGVMAAEVLPGRERQDATRAAAAIVAAQLATLIGPPAARDQAQPEAAAGA